MNILMACSWGSRQTTSGRGSFFFDQANLIKDRGYTIEMMFVNYVFGVRNKLSPDESKKMGSLKCHYIESKSIIPFFPTFNLWFNGYQLFNRVKQRDILTPDLIICQSMIELSHLAPLLKTHWSCPLVFIEHHSAFTSSGQYQIPQLLPIRIRKVQQSGLAVYAVSKFLCDELSGHRKLLNVKPIFNPIPLELERRRYKPPPANQFQFLAIGRYDNNKRIDFITRAFCQYHKTGGKGQLIVITGDEGRIELSNILRTNPSAPIKIRYEYGQLSRKQIFDAIESAHVVISCSRYETFGMSVLESLALARPVLSSDSGGPSDMIDETNGIITEIEYENDLVHGMRSIYERYPTFNLRQIKARALRKFNIDSWLEIITN